MKEFRCPHCARTFEKEDDIIIVLCPCGEYAKQVNRAILSNDFSKDNQIILKQVFDCGVQSGKQPDIQEILDHLDTSIKVNLK